MKYNFNKKSIASILLAGSLALSTQGCAKVADSVIDVVEPTTQEDTIDETPNQYIDKRGQVVDLYLLNNDEYTKIIDDDKYTLLRGASIYQKGEWNVSNEIIIDNSLIVSIICNNSTFSLVKLPNGEEGYVYNSTLIKCANLQKNLFEVVEENKNTTLKNNAYLYDSNGMYIGYVYENEPCCVVATNCEYALISLSDGTAGYVLENSLTNNYTHVSGNGYIKVGTNLYYDSSCANLAYSSSEEQVLLVEYINKSYAGVYDNNGNQLLYVKTSDLHNNFIIVNLNTQRMDCYLNCQKTNSWGVRSGKDASPTHTGSFDIDWKATDWNFTNYPDSKARYWIPFNEDEEEGIHDLVGDDEWNYGNSAYHNNGSHGCVRVPAAASEYVYNNYKVGDMVLVRKK